MFRMVPTAQSPGPDDATEIALHQRYTSALHRPLFGPHGDADVRLRQVGASLTPSPAIATT